MLYCVREDELDLARHEIVGGPWDNSCENCGSSSSSSSATADLLCYRCVNGACAPIFLGIPAPDDPCIETGTCCEAAGYYSEHTCGGACSSRSSSSNSSVSSGCCPANTWSGNGTLNITSACPNTSPAANFTYDPNLCAWVNTRLLADLVHTVTVVAKCDSTKTGCEKWSGEASTTCPDGAISVGQILTPCDQTPEPNGPPIWAINFTPGSCGCPCVSSLPIDLRNCSGDRPDGSYTPGGTFGQLCGGIYGDIAGHQISLQYREGAGGAWATVATISGSAPIGPNGYGGGAIEGICGNIGYSGDLMTYSEGPNLGSVFIRLYFNHGPWNGSGLTVAENGSQFRVISSALENSVVCPFTSDPVTYTVY